MVDIWPELHFFLYDDDEGDKLTTVLMIYILIDVASVCLSRFVIVPIYILCSFRVSPGDLLRPGLENCRLKLLNWVLQKANYISLQNAPNPNCSKARRSNLTDDNDKAGQVQSELSAGGTKQDIEHPQIYPSDLYFSPTIQTRSAAHGEA